MTMMTYHFKPIKLYVPNIGTPPNCPNINRSNKCRAICYDAKRTKICIHPVALNPHILHPWRPKQRAQDASHRKYIHLPAPECRTSINTSG